MKKIISSCLLILILSNIYSEDFKFGDRILSFKVGQAYNKSEIGYSDPSLFGYNFTGEWGAFNKPETEYKNTINIDFGIDFYLHKYFILLTGLSYISSEIKIIYPKDPDYSAQSNFKHNYKVTYLEIPFGIKLNIQPLEIGSGIYYGIPLETKGTYTYNNLSTNFSETSFKNGFGFFIVFVFKQEILTNQFLILETTYKHDFFNRFTRNDFLEINTIKNRSIGFNIGYGFKMK